MSLHRIIVDDTSPSIQYSSGWTDRVLSISISSDGPALFNTAHAASNAQNFTFVFNGMLKLHVHTYRWLKRLDNRLGFLGVGSLA